MSPTITIESIESQDTMNGDRPESSVREEDYPDSPIVENGYRLPPTDKGRDAWLVLIGCSLIQAPVWGFSLSFGVFQEFYTNLDELQGGKSGLANIGTLASGILYLSAPISFTILTRYPHLRRYCGPIGVILSVIGLLLSSFSKQVWQLIATLGVVSAVGSGLLYSPTTLYLDEWFVKRKGLAYGIMLASKSLIGTVLPFISAASLDRFGPRATLQAWAVITFLMTVPLLYYMKPRIPLATSMHPRKVSLAFLKLLSFWMLQTGNFFQSLGYFLPSVYLASYASDIGLNRQLGTMMIALFNATSIPGSLLLGMLNDRYQVYNVVLASTVGSAFAVFVFWGLADQVALLAVFAILYGFFAGGYSATWSGVMQHVKRERPALDTGLVFGLLAGARGAGNVVSGPVSQALIQGGRRDLKDYGSPGYETPYKWLIVFTGATAVMGGWGCVWRMWQKL